MCGLGFRVEAYSLKPGPTKCLALKADPTLTLDPSSFCHILSSYSANSILVPWSKAEPGINPIPQSPTEPEKQRIAKTPIDPIKLHDARQKIIAKVPECLSARSPPSRKPRPKPQTLKPPNPRTLNPKPHLEVEGQRDRASILQALNPKPDIPTSQGLDPEIRQRYAELTRLGKVGTFCFMF